MNRQEIIAAIDSEIERLQQARLLIAQSLLHEQPSKQSAEPAASASKQLRPSVAREPITRTRGRHKVQQTDEATARFTRVSAKEALKQRLSKTVSKHPTALTSNVPLAPVAVAPRKTNREVAPRDEVSLQAIASPSASAFGQAISRGLAGLRS